jgi:hypothetical protein
VPKAFRRLGMSEMDTWDKGFPAAVDAIMVQMG